MLFFTSQPLLLSSLFPTKKILFLQLTLIVFASFSYHPYAMTALTAMTAKTIQGSKPILNSDNAGDVMLSLDYKTKNITDTSVFASLSDKFSDYLAKGSMDSASQFYADNDGDIAATQPITFVNDSLKITWKKVDGTTVTTTSTTTLSDAGLAIGDTVQAIISAVVNITSAYGDPFVNQATIQKTVNLVIPNQLSGIKTLSQSPPVTFDTDSGFPTVGFYNAKFDLVMQDTASATNYTWSSSHSSIAAIDSSSGRVTLVNRGDGTDVTLTATGKTGTPFANHKLTYTIKTPIKWFVNSTSPSSGTWGSSVSAVCNNLTSTSGEPIASFSKGTYSYSSASYLTSAQYSNLNNVAGTRKIGSLFGEWGNLIQYTNAGWNNGWYYAKEFQGSYPQVFNSTTGALTRDTGLANRFIVCIRNES